MRLTELAKLGGRKGWQPAKGEFPIQLEGRWLMLHKGVKHVSPTFTGTSTMLGEGIHNGQFTVWELNGKGTLALNRVQFPEALFLAPLD